MKFSNINLNYSLILLIPLGTVALLSNNPLISFLLGVSWGVLSAHSGIRLFKDNQKNS